MRTAHPLFHQFLPFFEDFFNTLWTQQQFTGKLRLLQGKTGAGKVSSD